MFTTGTAVVALPQKSFGQIEMYFVPNIFQPQGAKPPSFHLKTESVDFGRFPSCSIISLPPPHLDLVCCHPSW